MTLDLVIRWDDDYDATLTPEQRAFFRRVEVRQRYHCEDCGAFISKAQGDACWVWTDYGNEWRPHCETGKGCRR